MRSIYVLMLVILGVLGPGTSGLRGAEFRLTDGDVLRGEAASFDDDGLVVRLEIGGFSPRISWGKVSQETLKQLVRNPQARKFVEPFIELPPPPPEKVATKKEIVVKPVERVERLEKTSFVASLASPAGLVLLGILYLANLFAAYEIAVFRNRPPAMVCGLSAFLPLVGPIVFLSLPSEEVLEEEALETAGGVGEAEGVGSAGAQAKKTTAKAVPAGPLSVAAIEKKGGSTPTAVEGMAFKRGDTTFNRRFFETKFPNFFRIVPSETEKDLVLVIKAAKNEYVVKRISRITANAMHLQLLRGGEEDISFAEVVEVQVRHKDDRT